MVSKRKICSVAASLIDAGEETHSCSAIQIAYEDFIDVENQEYDDDFISRLRALYQHAYVPREYWQTPDWLVKFIFGGAYILNYYEFDRSEMLRKIRYRMLMAFGRGDQKKITAVRKELVNLRRKYHERYQKKSRSSL